MIPLLTTLMLGQHTFSVNSLENVANTHKDSVTFSIVVTTQSIKDDVRQFLGDGAIKEKSVATLLLAELDLAASAQSKSRCLLAQRLYQAFLNSLQALSGRSVDASAGAIMTAYAQYLMAHCP